MPKLVYQSQQPAPVYWSKWEILCTVLQPETPLLLFHLLVQQNPTRLDIPPCLKEAGNRWGSTSREISDRISTFFQPHAVKNISCPSRVCVTLPQVVLLTQSSSNPGSIQPALSMWNMHYLSWISALYPYSCILALFVSIAFTVLAADSLLPSCDFPQWPLLAWCYQCNWGGPEQYTSHTSPLDMRLDFEILFSTTNSLTIVFFGW